MKFHVTLFLTFLVNCREAVTGHVLVRVEDDGHDVPGRREPRRGTLAAELSQEIPLVLAGPVVDFDVVIVTTVVILQVKVTEG